MKEVEHSTFSLPVLLDASSTHVHVGIPSASGWLSLQRSETPALGFLFEGLRRCLEETKSEIGQMDAIIFCEGPGSTLGLRAALTLAKTLQSQISPTPAITVYNALHAAALLCENRDMPILADYRQGQWFLRETCGDIRVVEETEALEIAQHSQTLRQRKSWGKMTASCPEVEYDLSRLEGMKSLSNILRPIEKLVLFDPRPATFRKWKAVPEDAGTSP
tara:strand:+ start:110 stop:766 length:657 start_codon:yes stop_codon:yes gene_type:complete